MSQIVKLLRTVIRTSKAPTPIGPYNQAIKVNNIVYLSGIFGMDRKTNKLVAGGPMMEAKAALTNMGIILNAAGSSYERVIRSTIMLKSIDDFGAVNEIYRQFFTKDFPARSCFQVVALPVDGASLEIEAIAVCGLVDHEITEISI